MSLPILHKMCTFGVPTGQLWSVAPWVPNDLSTIRTNLIHMYMTKRDINNFYYEMVAKKKQRFSMALVNYRFSCTNTKIMNVHLLLH